MADQQPGDATPAAGLPDEGTAGGDPAQAGVPHTESSTVDAPVRWSGSAAVPARGPKRAWWSRRRPEVERPEPVSDDPTDWATTPAVDPWAGQDTPWDPMTAVPAELPPTRMDSSILGPPRNAPPSTASPSTTPPPAAPPSTASPLSGPAPTGPSASGPAPAGPAEQPTTRRRRWGRRKQRGTAGAGAAAPDRRSADPAALQPPAAGAGARPAPPGSPTDPTRRRDRPPVPAAWRPQTAVPPPNPAWRAPAARPTSPPAGRPPTATPWPTTAPRRRRRWPRRLVLLTLFGFACCCGVPAAYLNWVPARQFPVTAVLPHTVADLTLRDDSASRRAVARLEQQLHDANARGKVFAGVYGDGNGKRVTIFGTTGLRVTPKTDVEAELRRVTGQFGLRDIEPYDLGETGVHERCGVGAVDGTPVVVCAWADHGSMATVVANRRSVKDSAELTGVFRSAVLTHG